MEKWLKRTLTVILAVAAAFGALLLAFTLINTAKTSVSEKANEITFSGDAGEIKAFFGDPIWSDEFDGETLDETVWTYSGHKLHRNDELQYYTDDANGGSLRLEDGALIIRADRLTEPEYGYDYSSVSLVTQNKKLFRYGYFEMRAQLPDGQGLWPAFWMMGQVPYLPPIKNQAFWPLCGEIDIMEAIGAKEGNAVSHGAIHWVNSLKEYFDWRANGFTGNYDGEHNRSFTLPEGTFETTGYHTFGLAWNEKTLVWYVDDTEFMREELDGEHFEAFRTMGWYILLNLAIGGNWPGSPDKTTPFPAEFKIDYIRVYQ